MERIETQEEKHTCETLAGLDPRGRQTRSNGSARRESVFALELTIPAERSVTVSAEEDALDIGDGCECLWTPQRKPICLGEP